MGEVAPLSLGLIAILKGLDRDKLTKPFGREIYIISTYIAGTRYYEASKVKDSLKPGKHLVFKRETDNKHDKKAIAILDLDQHKLGYLPQAKNEIISRLMDAGKAIYAQVIKKEQKGDYLNIEIKVFMREY